MSIVITPDQLEAIEFGIIAILAILSIVVGIVILCRRYKKARESKNTLELN